MDQFQLQFEAIGTRWDITGQLPGQSQLSAVERAVHARIDQFDKHYSRFRADSLVTSMASRPGTYTLPNDARPMLDLYQTLYNLTKGRMTLLIGTALEQAGYDASYSLQPKVMTDTPPWDAALLYDYPSLTLLQPVLLDVGAAGKGYLIDLVAGAGASWP
jgi:FAD:protein FMN transferase